MTRILVTGSSGMLGVALCQELADRYEVVGLDIKDTHQFRNLRFQESSISGIFDLPIVNCDITDRAMIAEEITKINPDLVIHTAAYTDVDGCEIDSDKAYRVNSIGTQNITLGCQSCGALLLYISTDFVFDGEKGKPYSESDIPNPINIYGKSKLQGEEFIRRSVDKFLIIRTSWLFGRYGRNFVDTVIGKAKAKKELKVVVDQIGSPTYTIDLAKAIKNLLWLVVNGQRSKNFYGIYHITNNGSTSWYDIARKILEYAGAKEFEVIPITSKELNRPARRPGISILDNSRYNRLAGQALRPWQDALKEYLSNEAQAYGVIMT